MAKKTETDEENEGTPEEKESACQNNLPEIGKRLTALEKGVENLSAKIEKNQQSLLEAIREVETRFLKKLPFPLR